MSHNPSADRLEPKRLALQERLDDARTQKERNRLGQFATPSDLAHEIVRYAAALQAGGRVRFLDPAFGTGAFFAAARGVLEPSRFERAVGFEIDSHYGVPARALWEDSKLELRVADFTRAVPERAFNLIVCNPPYVRHHHIAAEEKLRLQQRTTAAAGIELSGLAGLYCHFMALCHAWMEPDAIAAWLVPSEFMDVNYGRLLKRYLLEQVTLLHIHRFDPNDVQFSDALVSSAVVLFKNSPPPPQHLVRFSLGGTLSEPQLSRSVPARSLTPELKWSRFPKAETHQTLDTPTISDFFQVKRGVATGDNKFFIVDEETLKRRRLPRQCFRPVLPSPRYLPSDEVLADEVGNPILERRLYLLDTAVPETEIEVKYPSLWDYLNEGRARGLDQRYLCSHRTPWYAQEHRPPAPIVCTYLGRGDTKRGRPFRFILNLSQATVANVYLAMYPRRSLADAIRSNPSLTRRIWEALNSLEPEQLLGQGRVYGGGLHKLEPKELANVDASVIAILLPTTARPAVEKQLSIFGNDIERASAAEGV